MPEKIAPADSVVEAINADVVASILEFVKPFFDVFAYRLE